MPPLFELILETPEGTHTMTCRPDEYVWNAALRGGVRLPSICHQGRCLTCAGRLVAGTVDQTDADSYFPEDIREHFVLLCTAKPLTNLAVRLKIPSGGIVAAHWHPSDEYITVLLGTFAAGMGDKYDPSALHEFPTGSYVMMPKQMHHFASAKVETIVQVHGMGPFVLNYINPADDPRKAK